MRTVTPSPRLALALLTSLLLATIGWAASSHAQAKRHPAIDENAPNERSAAERESFVPLEAYFPPPPRPSTRPRTSAIPLSETHWTALGPAPIPAAQTPGNMPSSGRLAALAPHPSNASIIYVAAAGGGVWKTVDGGTSWTALTDDQATLSMGAIAIAPSNPSVVYAGTGEASNAGDNMYGRGVLRSVDGGATWTLMGSSVFDRRGVSRIAIDPTDANVVYVAVSHSTSSPNQSGAQNGVPGNRGIWKSSDGGATWTNTTTAISSDFNYSDLVMDPTNPLVLYAAVGERFGSAANGVYKTTNGGATWSAAGNFPIGAADHGRAKIAMCAGTPQTLYVIVMHTASGNPVRLMKTTDGGATWVDVSIGSIPGYQGGAGWYHTTLAVSPTDPNLIYAGGLGFIMSADGGASWTSVAAGADGRGPHVDHHGIGFDATGKLLVGCDGGIWRLDDSTPGTIHWTSLNGNLNTIQFIGIALDPSNPNIAFGGSQDNGTSRFDGDGWALVEGGDGGMIDVDDEDPSTVFRISPVGSFGSSAFFRRSDNGGLTFSSRTTGITNANATLFYPPFYLDPGNHNRLLLGSNVANNSTNRADSWGRLPGDVLTTPAGMDHIAVGPASPDIIYSTAAGGVFVTMDGGATWNQRNPAGVTDHFRRFVVDPVNSNTAYLVRDRFNPGGHVFSTTDAGLNWTDISSNLPDLPANDIVLDPGPTNGFTDDVLYVAMDVGVYKSTDLGGTWSVVGSGLANARVTDLDLNRILGILAAGTYGRGLWELSVPALVAVGPNITTPGNLAFGFVPVGEPSTPVQVTFRNVGTEDLIVSEITSSDAQFTLTLPALPAVVPPQTNFTFSVSFRPVSFGLSQATLTITSNALNAPILTRDMSGTGIERPADLCADALSITCGASSNGTTRDATVDAGSSCGLGPLTARGVWYRVIGNGTSITASTCAGSDFDTQISVYSGSCDALACVGSNDDFCGTSSQVTWSSVLGTNYYVLVHGFDTGAGAFTLTVSCPSVSTTTELLSDLNPSTVGANVSFTATVKVGVETATGTTGTVQFKDGAADLGTPQTVIAGVATLATTTLVQGTHEITAVYSGDGAYATSTSGAVSQVVDPVVIPNLATNGSFEISTSGWVRYGSATLTRVLYGAGAPDGIHVAELRATESESTFGITDSPGWVTSTLRGRAYRFVAWVRSASHRGSVKLEVREYNGSSQVGSTRRTSSFRLSPTWRELTLDFVPVRDGSRLTLRIIDDPSSSRERFQVDNVSITVLPVAATTTELLSSRNPSTVGASVTFTATVKSGATTATAATGTVQFKDGTANLGSPRSLAAGVATLATAALIEGTHSITAVYGGDAAFAASTSPEVSQVVNPAPPGGANLVANGSFETNTIGWSPRESALARVLQANAPDGNYVAELRANSSDDFGLNDNPSWVTSTLGGRTYRFMASVRSAVHRGGVQLQVREYNGSSQVGSTRRTSLVPLSPAWRELSLDVVAGRAGSSFDFQIVDRPAASREVFQVDRVSIALQPVTAAQLTGSQPSEPELQQTIEFMAPQVWPNPSRGETHLRFATSRSGPVRAAIYDVSGRLVRSFADETESRPAVHDFEITRSGEGEMPLSMGIYFYRVEIPEGVFSGRYVVLK